MRQSVLLRSLSLLELIGFLGVVAPAPAAHSGVINLDVIQRDGYGMIPMTKPRPNELAIYSRVNGHRAQLVVDTGDGMPGITLATWFARELNLGGAEPLHRSAYAVSGKITDIYKAVAKSVVMGPVQVQDMTVYYGSFQTPHDIPDSPFKNDADGYIGQEFLGRANAIVDLQNLKLYLRASSVGRRVSLGPALQADGLASAPLLPHPGAGCLVDVEINGVPAKMIVDTGAVLTVVDQRFANQVHLKSFRSRLRAIDAAGVKTEGLDRAVFSSFKIGGVPARPSDITVSDLTFYEQSKHQVVGLLGLDFLGQNWGIIDFGENKLYFAAKR